MKKGKKILLTMAVILVSCLAGFGVSLAVVLPKFQTAEVELGESISENPEDYLFGYDFIIKNADIDISNADATKLGQYKVCGDLWFYHYTFTLNVTDTTAPHIELPSNPVYIAADREYEPEAFVESIYDYSGEVKTVIDYGGKTWDSISFTALGSYTVSVRSEDASGNVKCVDVTFTVDDAPVIIGAFDRHLLLGTDYDVSKNIVAVDNLEGIISDRIEIDSKALNTNAVGEYSITYTVQDNYGLESSTTVTISVCDKNSLKNYTDSISLSDEELELLCDADYFKYSPLDEPDYDKTVSMIEPTLIDLKRELRSGWVAGSGVIYKITPQYVYFLSVEHVLESVCQGSDIMFFDGAVVFEKFNYVTSENKNEASIFKIETDDIPVDTLLSLKQIYVDPDIYSKIQKGDDVLAYAKHWLGTDKDLIGAMKVKKLTSSIRSFGFVDSLLETTLKIRGGMSGTAVVDYKGNLVGLVSAGGASSSGDSTSAYHSKIDCLSEIESRLDQQSDAE